MTHLFTQKTGVKYPLIMAPMFLVSNLEMLKSAIDSGIVGAIPSLNYLNPKSLIEDISILNKYRKGKQGSFAVNLIIKGNKKYEAHLNILTEGKVPIVITSLGDPSEVIDKVHAYGGLVLCDVTNVTHARKAERADGFIAVGQGAGGHAGNISLQILIPALRNLFPNKIIIGAGGIANALGFNSIMALGADAVSAGTVFIASEESQASKLYKNAIISAKAEDISKTKILSGVPATVIKSDYLNQLELELKKKKLSLERGVEILQNKGINADYNQIFVAGQAVEFVNEELSVAQIIKNIVQ